MLPNIDERLAIVSQHSRMQTGAEGYAEAEDALGRLARQRTGNTSWAGNEESSRSQS